MFRQRMDCLFRKIRYYNQIAQIDELARRYFVLNCFDGIMTSLGIIIANFLVGTTANMVVIIACIGAVTAVAISGFYGAYITESSEREGKLKGIERKVGLSLRKTPIDNANRLATLILAVIEGFVPFMISMLIIIPFFVFNDISKAYYFSIAIAASFLFMIGVFLGRIAKKRMVLSGLKMLTAGIICAVLIFLIENTFGV
jgi:predicted membrane protein (TIGR00267 family)